MALPSVLSPTRVANRGVILSEDWRRNPATAAAYLSGGRWKHAPHLDLVSERLERMADRPVFLIVTMPPRHGKSELISHWTPVWFLRRWPEKRVILASYGSSFASDWGGEVKTSFMDHAGELGLSLALDTKAKSQWRIQGYGGGMIATGVGGSITGRGGDLLIIDDPIKSQREALSVVYRESIKQWYKATFRTRAQPGASIILLMTRWHEDDLAGYLLNEAKNSNGDLPHDPWEVINMPALAEHDDILGRAEGEPLWPEMYPREALLQVKEAIGSYWFAAEYQGRPRPEEGAIIKEAWFGYFTEGQTAARPIQVWDTAFELGDNTSRSACMTWGRSAQDFLVLDVWAKRVEFPDLIQAVKMKAEQWKPTHIFIEHKASGHSLVQQLRRDTNLPIIPVKAVDDKGTRLHAISGIVEAGRVKLPARAPWLSEFLYEVCSFPGAKTDDIADCFAHGLMKLNPSLAPGTAAVRRGAKESLWRPR